MVTVIDGTDLRLGRLASVVAKRALQGEEIAIINAELVVISGSKKSVFEDYDITRKRGSREGGPFYPRRPEHIVKRTIRGMLPYKRQRGADALRIVKAYVGVPVQFVDSEVEVIESAHIDGLATPKYVTIGAISKNLGAKF